MAGLALDSAEHDKLCMYLRLGGKYIRRNAQIHIRKHTRQHAINSQQSHTDTHGEKEDD